MSAVMLIAMPGDHDRVRNIVGALAESDLEVYWERTDPASPKWGEAARRVMEARGVVVFWSAEAQAPGANRFRQLARRALKAGKAIIVRLDGSPIPAAMSGCTTYDLRGWRARTTSLFMLDLVAGVTAKAAGLDPPLPRAPRQLLLRRLAIAIPSLVAGFALLIGLYRDVGLDRLASPQEALAWSRLRPGSCEDLRGFLRAHSGGVHATEAQALLSAREVRTENRWRPATLALPLYVGAAAERGSPDEASARQAALARAAPLAQRVCRRTIDSNSGRLLEAAARIDRYECERFQSGLVCSLHGEAVCRFEELHPMPRETCAKF